MMNIEKLHDDEIDIDADVVRHLLASQNNHLSSEKLEYVGSSGTSNIIFRVGQKHLIRLPRCPRDETSLLKETKWLPTLSPQLSLGTPRLVMKGQPTDAFPLAWAIYTWLDGENFDPRLVGDGVDSGNTLANFVSELRSINPSEGPRSDRDSDLIASDPQVIEAIRSLGSNFDKEAITFAWETLSNYPNWRGVNTWTHGDLLPPNILVKDGRISAIIDFGLIGVGDPAVDLIPAWSTLRGVARERFRSTLQVDDSAWYRGQGMALRQALKIIPYYLKSNPGFASMACDTVEEILSDFYQEERSKQSGP